MTQGYAAQRRAKDEAKKSQRKCQRKGCDGALPVNAISRTKYCGEKCRRLVYEATRARKPAKRTEYHRLYQRARREKARKNV